MKKFFLLIFLIVIFGGIFFWSEILDFYSKLTLNLPQQWEEEKAALVEEVERQVTAPPPLRAEKESPESFLTQAGVIKWTNSQRGKEELPLLQENSKLNASAVIKAEDMLAKQYFDHNSPSGEGVADLAEMVGYEFIAIGENLAMGNFQDDEALVQGWVDSPGHRENILNPRYQEIGVAVLQGEFAGETTWLAVQHFALSLTACPQPSKTLSAEITVDQKELEEMETILKNLKLEIRKMRPRWGGVYDKKIEEYNKLVSQYNELLIQTQALIDQYNEQVTSFNECVLK